MTEATLYPGVALIEGTNVSVGRGTDTPFELVGAPWIKSRELAAYLNARGIAGVRFVPTEVYADGERVQRAEVQGVNIVVTDRNGFDAPELGIELAAALQKLYPADFKMERMAGVAAESGCFRWSDGRQDPRRIAQDWQDELEKFQVVRKKYLIY